MSKYQVFLLALSDQVLLTGIGMFIAIYSQTCSITAFSFQIANDLVFFCSTVHLATLTGLRVHFQKNKLQKRMRSSLIVLLLACVLASKFVQYLTWTHDPGTLEVCVIDDYEVELGQTIWDWLALAASLSWSYYGATIKGSPTT